jgi:hypothetical protein
MAAGACVTLALASTGCSGSDGEPGGTNPAGAGPTAASRYATPLAGVCPDTVVVQSSWWPGISHGFAYQLLGPNPTIDKGKNRVIGQLGGTGVKLEIRAGGPAVGFQPVSSILFQDDGVLLGDLDTDEAVQNSASMPTVAVFSTYDKTPLAFMWGDSSLNFTSVADVGRSGRTVLAPSGGNTYLDLLVREGRLKSSQIDTSYQGTPDRFIAEDGKIVQATFVTDDPYRLEHEVPQWGKPVKYLLLADEYPVYQNALSVRRDKLAANRDCLSKLVPLFQQAQRDYFADPEPTNQLLLRVVGGLETDGFSLSPGLLAYGSAKHKELKLIANGSDGVLGSFDTTRVQKLIDRLTPVFDAQGTKPKPGLAPADLVTNDFLDTSISLH